MDERPEESYGYIDPEKKVEAHIIADMLRIERISDELREFKETQRDSMRDLREEFRVDHRDLKSDINRRFDRQEKWMMSVAGVFLTGLLGFVGSVILNFMDVV